ncbi:hypothetical protein ABZP36_001045 [Zizania latifolia]
MAAAWVAVAAMLVLAPVSGAAPVTAPAFLWAPKNYSNVAHLCLKHGCLTRYSLESDPFVPMTGGKEVIMDKALPAAGSAESSQRNSTDVGMNTVP